MTVTPFELPPEIAATVDPAAYEDCDNCGSPTRIDELAAKLCPDCRRTASRTIKPTLAPEVAAVVPLTLLDSADELASRRALRAQVAAGAEDEPNGWVQVAIEAVRAECTRGRAGHEFTADTILAEIERRGYDGLTPPLGTREALRFVLRHAIQRGWCKTTTRTTRGPEGTPRRVYASCL